MPALSQLKHRPFRRCRTLLGSMSLLRRKVAVAALAAAALLAASPSRLAAQGAPATAVPQLMHRQVEAWNRGDVEAFMHAYEDSAQTTFIGKTVEHGYAMILARYRRGYPTKEAMGTLEFSDLNVRMLGPQYAVVTGRFHLARTAAGGGEASGVFSLVWEKTSAGWKIILDHTS